jgi:formate dehydrogenase subunit gamma
MMDYTKLNLIRVTNWFERLSHTILTISWMLLVFTGLAFYSKKFAIFAELFGGLRSTVMIHNYTGIVFLISVVMIFLAMFKESFKWSKDDLKWVLGAGGYLWWHYDVPESDRFNPGQKGMYFFTVLMGVVMGVTGWTMWHATTANYSRLWVNICYPIHSLGAIIFVAAWIIHAYFGSFCNPGSVASMTYGWVTRPWLKKQHGLWYKKYFEEKKG